MHVEDLWMKPGPNGRKTKTARHGKGSRWRAWWHEPDGTRRSKSFKTKDAAEAHLTAIDHQIRSHEYIPTHLGDITVTDYAREWLTHQLHQSPGTLRVIDRVIRVQIAPTLGNRSIGDVTTDHIQQAVTTWDRTLKPRTVRVAYAYTSMIFRHAEARRVIRRTPCRGISLPAIDRARIVAPTVDQVQAFIDAAPDPFASLAILIAGTGMRPAEARGATEDRLARTKNGGVLTIDRQLLTVAPTWGPPKTPGSIRDIGVGVKTLDGLHPSGGFLVGLDNSPISTYRAHRVWDKHGRHLGSGWHQLRHFHASILIARGASPVAVAARLGHKDATETLRTYGHMWVDDDDKMRDSTDGLVVLPAHTEHTGEVNPQVSGAS